MSAVGSRITRTALPMAAIMAIGADAFELGLLAVALSLPGVLVAWFAGGWVDRHRRRPLLIATDLIRAGALLVVPWVALHGALTLPVLYAVAAVVGISTVLFELADHVFPSLTSVATDAATWGALAARTLLASIAGHTTADVELDATRLVVRESTAAPPN